jgi:DNA repair protein RAD50
MSCTGELPPHTNKGKSFIHDPKVAGETEVKGQIKLRFYNALHQPFIVVRSFQLTQKKTDMTFKALDSTIQTQDPETGQMHAVPHRCAELNAMIPVFMGVSKAILENVIFVHQEESNWPLAEGQILKKKFDDIFSATKYTKALDDLRKIRKQQMTDTQIRKKELELLKTQKDHAARLRTQIADAEEKAVRLDKDIEQLDQQINECMHARSGLDAKLASMADFGDDIVSMKARYDLLVTTNAETYARFIASYSADDLELSEEDLESCVNDFESNLAASKAQLQTLERELQSAQRQLEALREQGDRESRSLGKLQAESEVHARNIEERDSFLRRICLENSLELPPGVGSGDGGQLSTEASCALMSAFQTKMDEARRNMDALRQRHRAADDAAGRAVDEVAAKINAMAESLKMKQESVRKNEIKLRELQMQLDSEAGANKHALEAARGRVAAKTEELQHRENELNNSSFEQESRQKTEEISNIASKTEALRSERKILSAAAEETSRMNYKAQELQTALNKVCELLNRYRSKLMLTLDVQADELPTPGHALVAAVRTVAEQRRSHYDSVAAALKEKQYRKSAADGTLQATRIQLTKLESEFNELSQKLQAATSSSSSLGGGQSIADSMKNLETDRKNKEVIASRSKFYNFFVTGFIDAARSKNVCMTCRRPFSSAAECQAFIATKEKELEGSSAENLRAELEKVEKRMQELKVLEPVAVRHDALRDSEIPLLKERIVQLENEVALLQDEVDDAARGEESAGHAMQEAQDALQEAALPLASLANDAAQRQSEVESLRATVRTTDAARSVSTVDSELAGLEARRAELERAKEVANSNLARLRDAVSSLRSEVHHECEVSLRLSSAVEKRASLESQRAEILAANEAMTTALIDARKSSAPLEQRRSVLQREREDARAVARSEEAELEETLRSLQTQETQLEARERTIREYQQRGGPTALAQAEEKLVSIRARQSAEEQKCRDLSKQVGEQRGTLQETESFNRQILEITAYRKSKKEEATLATDLDRAGAALAAVGDRSSLEKEIHALSIKERELRSEADRARGQLEVVQEGAVLAMSELEAPEYDGIDLKHRRALIEMRTTEMASGDLDKFHKALERALLSFHTTKMSEINKIVKELWQKTYRNSDIDYIQIRADTESGVANRSYNYRVVMVCGGAELDMRGRCSAGQRVLASLIIRLALAETFCLNCGILALDEPTTNLDAENAASLAEALKQLMLARREQENFQLVVITHDEAFARHIGTREHAEFMWRIVKDENQHSTVMKEDIWE